MKILLPLAKNSSKSEINPPIVRHPAQKPDLAPITPRTAAAPQPQAAKIPGKIDRTASQLAHR